MAAGILQTPQHIGQVIAGFCVSVYRLQAAPHALPEGVQPPEVTLVLARIGQKWEQAACRRAQWVYQTPAACVPSEIGAESRACLQPCPVLVCQG